MGPSKPLKKFNSTIAELYAVCRLCWNSCLENLAAFADYKTFYTPMYVQAAHAEIDAAEDMPSEQVRNEAHETLHTELQAVGKTCLQYWRGLRGYIKSSFPEDVAEGKIEAAGGGHYALAINENWEEMELMLNEGGIFITANAAALATGGMPGTFTAAYTEAFGDFSEKYAEFKDAQQDAEEGTVNRMLANNAIYEKVQKMNADGQIVFEDDPAKFNRFVFARVKDLVTPEGGVPSTTLIITGVVKNGGTQQPMQNLLVQLTTPGAPVLSVNTNELGRYAFEFTGLTPGTVTSQLKVEAPGFVIFEKDLTMTIGNKYNENFSLMPV